jgi:hypothetical protein
VSCSVSSCAFLIPPCWPFIPRYVSIHLTCLPASLFSLNLLLLHALPTQSSPEPYRGLLLNTQFPSLGCSADIYTRAEHRVPRHVVFPRKNAFPPLLCLSTFLSSFLAPSPRFVRYHFRFSLNLKTLKLLLTTPKIRLGGARQF